mmetsp:Transcript_15732/g.59842  ORF Transcript_15732/g.59842 Transcript_15732/m.59842 type:complete len:343 (+) Transcript_15732:2210-3238(+)
MIPGEVELIHGVPILVDQAGLILQVYDLVVEGWQGVQAACIVQNGQRPWRGEVVGLHLVRRGLGYVVYTDLQGTDLEGRVTHAYLNPFHEENGVLPRERLQIDEDRQLVQVDHDLLELRAIQRDKSRDVEDIHDVLDSAFARINARRVLDVAHGEVEDIQKGRNLLRLLQSLIETLVQGDAENGVLIHDGVHERRAILHREGTVLVGDGGSVHDQGVLISDGELDDFSVDLHRPVGGAVGDCDIRAPQLVRAIANRVKQIADGHGVHVEREITDLHHPNGPALFEAIISSGLQVGRQVAVDLRPVHRDLEAEGVVKDVGPESIVPSYRRIGVQQELGELEAV